MRTEHLLKITRVHKIADRRWKDGKQIEIGPYWYGYFKEGGKWKKTYIGKELPIHLEWLLKGRYKIPGRKQWTWPEQKVKED